MARPGINVNLIRAFSGPRHDRLERVWDVILEHQKHLVTGHIFANPGAHMSHAQCLNALWEEELKRPEPFALLTEYDFLPNLPLWLPTIHLAGNSPILAAEYITRDPKTRRLLHHDIPGAWYILIDKTRIGALDFSGAGDFNDPANGLVAYVTREYNSSILLLNHEDCYPRHYGARLMTGEHLFFSRHLHDDPHQSVAGLHLGDIQRKHDWAVEDWIRNAPLSFRRLFKKRCQCV